MSPLSPEFILSRRQAFSNISAPKPVLNRMRRLGVRRFATKCEKTNQALAHAQNFHPNSALSFYSSICFYSSLERYNNSSTRTAAPPLLLSSMSPPPSTQLRAEAKTFVPQNTDHLPTITVINARSLNNKAELLNQLLYDAKVDIAVVTETWLNAENVGIVEQQLNNEFTKISITRDGRRGGGVTILIRKNYASKVININISQENNPDDINSPLELLAVRVSPTRRPRGYADTIIVGVYLAAFENEKIQQDRGIRQTSTALHSAITSYKSSNKSLVYVAGDFNGANIKPLLDLFGLYQINKHPTRGSKCLDLILTNSPKCYNYETWPELGASDHKIVVATAPSTSYRSILPRRECKLVRSGKIEDTVATIRNVDWSYTMHLAKESPQEATDELYNILRAAEELNQPLKKLRLCGDKPWMNSEIKRLIIKRQYLYKKGDLERWKIIAQKIKRLIDKRKKIYYRNKYTVGKPDYWKEVRALSKPDSTNNFDVEIAENLNTAFHNVWSGNRQPDLSRFRYPDAIPPACPVFTYSNVSRQLKMLKSSAPGPDEISALLLKSSRLEIVEVLTTMFNEFVNKGFIPDQWKGANITPIPKVKHPQALSDYRPISLTSNLCKTFERILARYIVDLTHKTWENNNQYGFLPKKSTMDAIVQVIDDWGETKDRKDEITAIFFDFAKAFDLVDHGVLLEKLDRIFPEWLSRLIAAYLSLRRQRVKIGDIVTEWKKVEAGVVQGSVLGPILFILFIHDINQYLPPECKVMKYADDILAYLLGRYCAQLPQKIAEGVERWCKDNKMRLNEDKCKVLYIPGQQISPKPVATISGKQLELVDSYKYLGIIINNELDWTDQWEKVQKSSGSTIYLLKRLKTCGFTENILVSVYRSYFLSHINYSSPALLSATLNTTAEIQRVQSRALKIIGLDEEQALQKHGILAIRDFIAHTSINVLKRILSDPTHPLTTKLSRENQRLTRSSFKFEYSRARTEAYNNSIVPWGIRLLRDGREDIYKPIAKALKRAKNKKRPVAIKNKPTPVTKPKTACQFCGNLYVTGSGIKIHEGKCKKKVQSSSSSTIK